MNVVGMVVEHSGKVWCSLHILAQWHRSRFKTTFPAPKQEAVEDASRRGSSPAASAPPEEDLANVGSQQMHLYARYMWWNVHSTAGHYPVLNMCWG